MAGTRRIVPRGDLEGSIGSGEKRWEKAYIGNVSITYDTLADLKDDLELMEGSTATTKGYYAINDGGAAVYTIREKGVSDADDGGSVIFLDNGKVAELLVSDNTINVKQFGAKGDNTANDYYALQAALDFVPNGGCVYFPKGRYKINDGLVLEKNDVTIYSDFRAEYLCTIYSDQSITILTTTGYGARIQGINFWGNGSSEVFGTTHGISFDRRSLGDEETYSNLDAEVRDCGFIYINTCITGYGRNVFVFDCIFSNSKIGVKGQSFIYGDNQYADLRGWRITGNRFHSMGNPIRYLTQETLDTWCIQFPEDDINLSHVEIANNNADWCFAGFYTGAMFGFSIHDNYLYQIAAPFIVSHSIFPINNTPYSTRIQTIINNVVTVANIAKSYSYAWNIVDISKCCLLFIKGNVIKEAPHETYKIYECYEVHIDGDSIINNNSVFLNDPVKRNVIAGYNLEGIEIKNMFVRSQQGNSSDYLLKETGNTTRNLMMKNNVLMTVDAPTNITVDKFHINSVGEGMPWVVPSFKNGWSYNAGTGYRRRFDGFVEINLRINPGTDNTVAFTLPAGCHPRGQMIINGATYSPLASANEHYVVFETNGDVIINYMGQGTPTQPICIHIVFEAAG